MRRVKKEPFKEDEDSDDSSGVCKPLRCSMAKLGHVRRPSKGDACCRWEKLGFFHIIRPRRNIEQVLALIGTYERSEGQEVGDESSACP